MVLFAMLFSLVATIRGERPVLQASDVVFMYAPRDKKLYEIYSGTVVGWAGRSRSKDDKDVYWFRKQVEEAHKFGLKYCGSVDFVVDFGGFIDFCPDGFEKAICRDLDGNPLTVPWLWDHRHNGHPAYWFCTNNPDYRAYLKEQVERACVADIDGLHIDDWRGTSACSAWFGGCFCEHCREGFKDWLKAHFGEEELKRMGIEDIQSFDYAVFLKSKGVTKDSWRAQAGNLPLADLYQSFQRESSLKVVGMVFEYAEQIRGKPLLRSVNSSASTPEALRVAPLVDFFCGEMEHQANTKQVYLEPAFVYRLVEGLGKRQAATAGGYDWAFIAEKEKPGMVRTWIAQAYAFGSVFMVPHHQWCYTQEKGTHWWEGNPEDFAPLYRFVRENASLFDGYVSLSDVAFIYTDEGFDDIRGASLELLEKNVPFSVIGAEKDRGGIKKENLEKFRLLIKGKGSIPKEIEKLARQEKKKILQWEGYDSLPWEFRNQVIVRGSDKLRVSLRYKPGSANAPIVCHLLNQDYDFERDDVRPVDIEVSLSKALLGKVLKSFPGKASVYIPGKPMQKVNLKISDERISFNLTNLGLWAIVVIGG
ncbi:beta-galactosidase [bacterium]|nr:beta-galactosidase [bacterium]